jgi:hypothetical protein
MEDKMVEVTDFSKYTDAELRKLLIDNAKPIAGGMARVVREITKKYNACDREMLMWFINRPPYNGKLYAPYIKRIITAEIAAREEKRIEVAMERAHKERVKVAAVKMPKVHTVTQIYAKPPQPKMKEKSIMTQFKELGCKPVMIADHVIGIVRMGSYAAIDKVKATHPDWKVVEV